MKQAFITELQQSGYLHRPLPVHREDSLEADMAKKPVLKTAVLWGNPQEQVLEKETEKINVVPIHEGVGTLEIVTIPEDACVKNANYSIADTIRADAKAETPKVLRLTAPTGREGLLTEKAGSLNGIIRFNTFLVLTLPQANLSEYQRLAFRVYPHFPGGRSVHLRCGYVSVGPVPVPDPYGREGQHLCNLENEAWNEIFWECALLPKDAVTRVWFKVDVDGKDIANGEDYAFDFTDIRFEKIAQPEKERGWQVPEGQIAYSMAGYVTEGPKQAIWNGTGENEKFQVLDMTGQVVYEGTAKIEARESAEGQVTFAIADFSDLTTPGEYILQTSSLTTRPFPIGDDILEEPIWKLLNFIFSERCGYPVPGKHGVCHTDVIARYKDLIFSYAGGWHDAGDLSQQSLQTAEVAEVLMHLSARIPAENPLKGRLLEEAAWGMEHVLRTRLGGGVRASSVGIASWTDGLIGNKDDIDVRFHNQAFQNFFEAAVEAEASRRMADYDPTLVYKCLEAAKEDYRYAKERFDEYGIEYPIQWEHTLGSSLSLYYAAAVRGAAKILQQKDRLTEEEITYFTQEAVLMARGLMACQETGTGIAQDTAGDSQEKGDGSLSAPIKGFFYRDETHRMIVHFNHQGRDHLFVSALYELCQALPNHPEKAEWEASMRLYGEYLKSLITYAYPYHMLPAGIHHVSEAEDAETFKILHLLVKYEEEKQNYLDQVEAGEPLGGGFYVRQFPVWFSFRGNSAMMLGEGTAAAILGHYFHDPELKAIAMDQLYFFTGKNPFAQSLIYGVGHRYASQDANFVGETVGEAPVGIETLNNEDIPYYPAGNNATYKEVWMTTVGRLLDVIGNL